MPYLIVDECKLFFTVKGQGTPIVFIHPPALTHLNFECQIEGLSKYFQVITFDIRGHGRSSFSKKPLTYPLIAEDIRHILDHLKIQKAFICGYSTGGTIVLEFLLSHPDRAYGGIVVSGMSEISDSNLKKRISLAITLVKFKALSVVALATSWTNTKSKSSFWKMLIEEHKGSSQNIVEYYRYSLFYSCTDKLERIKNPVLLVYGKEDDLFQHYGNLLHEKLANSELKLIPHAKHQIPTSNALELNDFIWKFIETHLSAKNSF